MGKTQAPKLPKGVVAAPDITAAEVSDMRDVLSVAPKGGYSAKTLHKLYGRAELRVDAVLRHMLSKGIVTMRLTNVGSIEMWELVR